MKRLMAALLVVVMMATSIVVTGPSKSLATDPGISFGDPVWVTASTYKCPMWVGGLDRVISISVDSGTFKIPTLVNDGTSVTFQGGTNGSSYIKEYDSNAAYDSAVFSFGDHEVASGVLSKIVYTPDGVKQQKISATSSCTGPSGNDVFYGGHFYRYVEGNISWPEAVVASRSTSDVYYGGKGYLVTATTKGENTTLLKLIIDKNGSTDDGWENTWMGGLWHRKDTGYTPSNHFIKRGVDGDEFSYSDIIAMNGSYNADFINYKDNYSYLGNNSIVNNSNLVKYYWIDGPEAGQEVPMNADSDFKPWHSGEPYNGDFMYIGWEGAYWDDGNAKNAGGQTTKLGGYIIEFSGFAGGDTVGMIGESSKTVTPPSTVVLASGSLGTASDKSITGLTSGVKYQVTIDGSVKYVKANGTLTTTESEVGALIGTSITGLINDSTYKVSEYNMTDARAVYLAHLDFGVKDMEGITEGSALGDIALPLNGLYNTTITWKEQVDQRNCVVIKDNNLIVTRPKAAEGDQNVTLTATITKGNISEEKDLTFVIKSLQTIILSNDSLGVESNTAVIGLESGKEYQVLVGNTVKYVKADGTLTADESEVGALSGTQISGLENKSIYTVENYKMTDSRAVHLARLDLGIKDIEGATSGSVLGDVALPLNGLYNTTITWSEVSDTGNCGKILGNTVMITRPSARAGDQMITLLATVTKNGVKEQKEISFTVKALQTVFLSNGSLGLEGDGKVTGLDKGKQYQIRMGNFLYYITADGTLTGDEDQEGSLNGTEITGLVNSQTYTVEAYQLSDFKAVHRVKTDMKVEDITKVTGADANLLVENLALPVTETYGTTITWTELVDQGNCVVIKDNNLIVTRPKAAAGDQTVILLATITKGNVSETKDFTFIVKSLQTVIVTQDSLGTESDKAIVGLESGKKYQVLVGDKMKYVKADGTLTSDESEVGALSGTQISGLENKSIYTVENYKMTDSLAVQLAKSALKETSFVFSGGDRVDSVKDTIVLPNMGEHDTKITWSELFDSDVCIVIKDNTIKVTRPTDVVGNQTVTIIATIKKGDVVEKKSFTLTIIALPPVPATGIIKVDEITDTLIKGNDISGVVGYSTKSLVLSIHVKAGTTWKLYSDKACTKLIDNKKLNLQVGINQAYVKVIAPDGTSKIFTVKIARKKQASKVVFIATNRDFSDALAGSVLASQMGGKMVTMGKSNKEMKRMLAYIKKNYQKTDKIYMIGLYEAIKKDFEKSLSKAGYKNIVRMGGQTKYDTAKILAGKIKLATKTKVILVNGMKKPKNIAAIRKLAKKLGCPILYYSGNQLPKATVNAIKKINPSKVYFMGGSSAHEKKVIGHLVSKINIKK